MLEGLTFASNGAAELNAIALICRHPGVCRHGSVRPVAEQGQFAASAEGCANTARSDMVSTIRPNPTRSVAFSLADADAHGPPASPARHVFVLLALVFAWDTGGSHAADPQPYKVTIAPTGEAALDQAAHDASTLISLHDTAPVGPFALVARARGDLGRFNAVLGSFGHYAGKVAITIAGHPLDDPGLPDVLDAAPAGTRCRSQVTLDPGPAVPSPPRRADRRRAGRRARQARPRARRPGDRGATCWRRATGC